MTNRPYTTTRDQIQTLYLAYCGRPCDPEGLDGWQNSYLSASSIVEELMLTEEYRFNTLKLDIQGVDNINEIPVDNYSEWLAGLINTFYNRLFARNAEPEEIEVWSQCVTDGTVYPGYLGITIANAGLNLIGSDFANTLNTRIEAANSFSDALQTQSLAERYSSWLAVDVGMDFMSNINEYTTEPQAAALRAAAFARLPEAGVLIEVSESSSSVAEGSSVAIAVAGFGPEAAGAVLDYRIFSPDSFSASDLADGSLTGQITLDANGNGVIQVAISEDRIVDDGESFAVRVSSSFGGTDDSGIITVADVDNWRKAQAFELGWESTLGDINSDEIIGSSIADANSDGFVDGVSNYQLFNSGPAIDITWHGRTYSDATTVDWDAVKAVSTESGYKVLLEGTATLKGLFYFWDVNSTGAITAGSGWKTDDQAVANGWEELFGTDININGSINLLA